MKFEFYPKLALLGIRKNKQLYVPYLFTWIGMVLMYYIFSFLSGNPLLLYLPGSDSVQVVLALGSYVLAVFSALFLFYTNSFLIRRRKKEFGLYNILGMGKKNIGIVLFWETVMITAAALFVGLFAGITFSKLAELGLINMLHAEVNYSLSVSMTSIRNTVLLFCILSVLLYFNTLRQIHTANPITLLRSENSGEKPPKANWLFGLFGLVLLAAAYYIAVSIQSPLSALVWFFVAVIMVIVATYLLFISGSVLLCRILQKKKNYYYKAKHFVSVSSMVYRMKRNGAGLASICILGTMVLVMITGSACLYFGTESSLRTRYPKDINISIALNPLEDTTESTFAGLQKEISSLLSEAGISPKNVSNYRWSTLTGLLQGDELVTDTETVRAADSTFQLDTYDQLRQIYFVPLSDYNSLMGTSLQLKENQTLLFLVRCDYPYDTLTIKNGTCFEIAGFAEDFVTSGDMAMSLIPSMVLIVPDLTECLKPLLSLEDFNGDRILLIHWNYGFDTDAAPSEQIALWIQIYSSIREYMMVPEHGYSYSCESLEANREDFYGTYGSIFFLGIMLSLVFLSATVLMIYYKQISEGYEDQARFEIMQKVGMTKKDIRKSINSQMLTVFFLPLITAVIHLAFAFPMIHKLLLLFNLRDLPLLVATACISVLIFAVFYTLVYRITSNVYYSIVSGAKEKN
ncbi:MAG: FtsX-like permease family protein [Lachnospiraceae bacterium]